MVAFPGDGGAFAGGPLDAAADGKLNHFVGTPGNRYVIHDEARAFCELQAIAAGLVLSLHVGAYADKPDNDVVGGLGFEIVPGTATNHALKGDACARRGLAGDGDAPAVEVVFTVFSFC